MRLLAMLALAACGVPQPDNREVEAPPGAEAAAALVVGAWSELLDAALDARELPLVRWFEGPCLDYGDDDGRCTTGGYAESPGAAPEIHLVAVTPLHESKLAHEALHWALDVTAGRSDQHHVAASWSLVAAVDDALAAAGL